MIQVYYTLKFMFLLSLIRAVVKNEPLQDRFFFIAALYTAGVAFLFWAFFLSSANAPDWRSFEIWLGKTFLLSSLYFWLLGKLDPGFLFVVLLVSSLFVVAF